MPKLQTPYGEIYYQVTGEGEKAIGFMNGVMASESSWDFFKEAFGQHGYQVITFDFIGQLRSDKPEGPYTFDQHVDEAYRLYKHLDIDSLHLIGTSYGSEVAMKFAMQYPEMVKTLHVIDGTAEITPEIQEGINQWVDLTYKGGKEFFWGMAPSIYHPDFIERNKEMLDKRAEKLIGQDEYLRGQRILYQTFLNEVRFLDELDQIKVPTIVIVGEQDTLKPPSVSKNIHQKIENSEYLVIPDCGHVTIFEKPQELFTILLGFVKKHD